MHPQYLEKKAPAEKPSTKIESMWLAQKWSDSMTNDILRLLAIAFLENGWSFRSVENESFRKCVEMMTQNRLPLFKQKGLVNMQIRIYKDAVNSLKTLFTSVNNIAFTTDAATLSNKEQYLTVTAHFIDGSWRLQKMVMAVMYAPDPHTQFYIRDLLQQVIQQWEVQNKANYIVTDNGANFLAAMKLMNASDSIDESLRCSCHTLHLAVTQALKHPDAATVLDSCRKLASLRSRSSFFTKKLLDNQKARVERDRALHESADVSQEQKMQQLDIVVDATISEEELQGVTDLRAVSVTLNEAAEDLSLSSADADSSGMDVDNKEDDGEEKSQEAEDDSSSLITELILHKRYALKNDCITRWNSTLLMIERVHTWKEEINQTLDQLSMPEYKLDAGIFPVLATVCQNHDFVGVCDDADTGDGILGATYPWSAYIQIS